MQTGKETTETHTVSLDGEERAFPDPQWKTGMRARFPWTGFIALSTVLLCAASSVIVLLVSDGHSQKRWADKVAPNVLLSGFNGIANICFGVAIGNGVAITWWRKALKGATIQDLHRSWAFSSSIKDVVIYGKYFNFIALAALAAKLTIIDGILLQKAASTAIGDDLGIKVKVSSFVNDTMPFTGAIAGRSTNETSFYDWFNKDLDRWSKSSGILPNPYIFCDGTCVLDIHGAGFEFDCVSEETPMNYGADAVQDAVALATSNDTSTFNGTFEYSLFGITFESFYGDAEVDGDYSRIVMNVTSTMASSSENDTYSCPGNVTKHSCVLRPAIISYPVTVEDTTQSLANNVQSSATKAISNMYLGYNTTSYGGQVYYEDERQYNATNKQLNNYSLVAYKNTVEDHFSGNGTMETSIAGLAKALVRYYQGSSSMHFDGIYGFLVTQNGSAEVTYGAVPLTSHGCDLEYQDPLDTLVQDINALMFSLSVDPWQLNEVNNNWSEYKTINATQYGTSIHYKTNRAFMYGAIASILLCILCVLPSYYGYWQLGRDVTLGPFEIANAFRAPVLDHPAVANAGVKDLIREVGKREVKYGEMVHNEAPGRLAIAEPDAVRRVHPRINDRRW